MNFWIIDEAGDELEAFQAEGHTGRNLSAHLDAMKVASAWGYSGQNGHLLHTEDGFIYEIVDPYADEAWRLQAAFDLGALIDRAA